MDGTMRRRTRPVLLCLVSGISLTIVTYAREQGGPQTAHDHGVAEHFGSVQFETSCSAAVQPQFDRAVAMLHSFFYPETEKAFQAIADREPSCAMAYWGLAISKRPNPLTAPFAPALLTGGWEATQNARAAGPKTARERDWIEALAPFFDGHDTVDQTTRTRRYSAAMEALHAKYPNDSEAAVFYALSLLEAVDLTDTTYRGQLKAAAILERLQQRLPNHPGIVHYLIHSYDYAPIAAKGLPAARRYATLAPSAPHALHMPSHIFSTLGMWQDAIQTNLVADRANIAYAAASNPKAAANTPAIISRYHALDFLTYAYLQLAQDRQAKAIVDQRNTIATMAPEERITAHTAYAAIPVRYAIERGAWQEAAGLEPTRTPFKEAEAIIWFGRVVGASRGGDHAAAKRDLAHLSRLRQELARPGGDPYWAEQVGIQETAALAWVALGESRVDEAIAAMQKAADWEDRTEKHIAMENRLWPMRELLGELLIEAGKPREALQHFERSLRTVPNRFRSLAGAARAASDVGNRRLAESYYRKLLALAANAEGERPELVAARKFLGSRIRQ
jgi:tetratricopeptide (TPR) repeat protein